MQIQFFEAVVEIRDGEGAIIKKLHARKIMFYFEPKIGLNIVLHPSNLNLKLIGISSQAQDSKENGCLLVIYPKLFLVALATDNHQVTAYTAYLEASGFQNFARD